MTLLIAPTTSAVTSGKFSPFADNSIGLTCSLLGANEFLTLQVWDEGINGAVTANDPVDPGWTNVIINNLPFQCSSQNNIIDIFLDSLIYRVVKTATVLPIGVGGAQTVNLLP